MSGSIVMSTLFFDVDVMSICLFCIPCYFVEKELNTFHISVCIFG